MGTTQSSGSGGAGWEQGQQESARQEEEALWEVENRRAARELARELAEQEKQARQLRRAENERSAARRAVHMC